MNFISYEGSGVGTGSFYIQPSPEREREREVWADREGKVSREGGRRTEERSEGTQEEGR